MNQVKILQWNKKKIEKKDSGWEYLSLALYAFLGLGCEMLLAYLIEPMIYGHGLSEFTLMESIIHWCLTCTVWIIFAALILRYAKNKLDFNLSGTQNKISLYAWGICVLFVAFITFMNYKETGAIKPYHELLKMGTVKFIFQHIYYFVETILFTLIIVFGQIAMEKWTKKTNFPFGGIIVGCTWGLAHIFTKGSLLIGLEGMVIGFIFGTIYLLLQRNVKKTYIVLALAFIL